MRVFNFGMRTLACVAVLSMATIASAQTWDEINDGGGDAGDYPNGNFQSVIGSFDTITGNNTVGGQGGDTGIDSYNITVTDAANFFIFDTFGNDTKAFLWDKETGSGVFANDDNPSGQFGFSFGFGDANSHTGNLIGNPGKVVDGGEYVLSIGAFGDSASGDAGGTVFFDDGGDFAALTGPTGENFAGWNAGGAGEYSVSLQGARFGKVIPEPASAGLLALGVVGLVLRRRK